MIVNVLEWAFVALLYGTLFVTFVGLILLVIATVLDEG